MKKNSDALRGTTLLGFALFSDRFRYLRKRMGLSQTEVAKLSGMSLRVFRRFEGRNIAATTLRELFELGRVVGCKPEVRFVDDGDRGPTSEKDASTAGDHANECCDSKREAPQPRPSRKVRRPRQ